MIITEITYAEEYRGRKRLLAAEIEVLGDGDEYGTIEVMNCATGEVFDIRTDDGTMISCGRPYAQLTFDSLMDFENALYLGGY